MHSQSQSKFFEWQLNKQGLTSGQGPLRTEEMAAQKELLLHRHFLGSALGKAIWGLLQCVPWALLRFGFLLCVQLLHDVCYR